MQKELRINPYLFLMKFDSFLTFCRRMFFFIGLTPCLQAQMPITDTTKIAFMADVHLLDVFGKLKDNPYEGVEYAPGKKALLRTMSSQSLSTRLFNENYFAFIAALDQAAKQGIKLIVLPGDFSDDGQPLNLRGLSKILDHYRSTRGMSFYLVPGNHDPTRPFGSPGGKKDFLGSGGKPQPIMSSAKLYSADPKSEHQTVISSDISEAGYQEILDILGENGFRPNKTDLFWATPFSSYSYENYRFELAQKAAELEQRNYPLKDSQISVPDLSYIVEPVKGIWLLALDANVYQERHMGSGFKGSSIGYNELLAKKSHLLQWSAEIAREAKRLGKQLITFSHYPMLEFNNGASEQMIELFGPAAFQAHRIPQEEVGRLFADAGLQVHVGGHMHLNDTQIYQDSTRFLVNIQTPSLAAYPPAFKVLHLNGSPQMQVETVLLDSVPQFSTFFSAYREEYAFLKKQGTADPWNPDVLGSKSYWDYCLGHLRNLIHLRFLPNEWPEDFQAKLRSLNGFELLALSKTPTEHNTGDLNSSALMDWTGEELILAFYLLRNGGDLAFRDIHPQRLEQYLLVTKSFANDPAPDDTFGQQMNTFSNIFLRLLQGGAFSKFSDRPQPKNP